MSQKDAVFSAVSTVIINSGLAFVVGTTDAGPILNKQLRSQINDILVSQFTGGTIELSGEAKNKLNDVAALRAYVSGLVSNWVRKDTRLNGGKTVVSSIKKAPKTSDAQLSALKQLLKTQSDSNKKQEIQGFIDKRVTELAQQ